MIPCEDPEDFEALHEGLRAGWQPKGISEDLLVERIATCWWKLQRAVKFEAAVMRYHHLAFEADRAEERVSAQRGTERKEPPTS